jgi:predicted DNA-binding transcriptional regulator AlpA
MSLQLPASPDGLSQTLATHRLLTSDEAAVLLAVPVATLRTWRSRRRGYGPRAVQVGGSVRYRLADLLEWIDRHVETADGHLRDGVEESQRGRAAQPDLPRLTRNRRPDQPAASVD